MAVGESGEEGIVEGCKADRWQEAVKMVDERGTELAWFENPTWERHVIVRDVPRTINLDVYDYDGDGIPEIAMGHNFETAPEKSIGNVLILKSGPDGTGLTS